MLCFGTNAWQWHRPIIIESLLYNDTCSSHKHKWQGLQQHVGRSLFVHNRFSQFFSLSGFTEAMKATIWFSAPSSGFPLFLQLSSDITKEIWTFPSKACCLLLIILQIMTAGHGNVSVRCCGNRSSLNILGLSAVMLQSVYPAMHAKQFSSVSEKVRPFSDTPVTDTRMAKEL